MRTLSHGGNEKGLVERKQKLHSAYHTRNRGVSVSESTGYLGLKDAFYQGSLASINLQPQGKSKTDIYRSITSIHSNAQGPIHTIRRPTVLDSVDPYGKKDSSQESFLKRFAGGWNEFRQIIVEMFNPAILTDPLFFLFMISNFLTSMGFNAPLVFLPDRAVEEFGISKNGASLTLSAFGIANTVGRLAIGYISDKKWPCRYGNSAEVNRLWIYNISLTICGICTVFTFMCIDLPSMLVYSAIFGFSLSKDAGMC